MEKVKIVQDLIIERKVTINGKEQKLFLTCPHSVRNNDTFCSLRCCKCKLEGNILHTCKWNYEVIE